ncbi:putative glycosyl hydrolases family 18 protein [Elsinoe australis]|uniref:Putative glycosyl hydrolases family 18 protein n=1 Tax=Elsinoe australis TaxID=40998 RepID=A0A4U7AWH9_9PEZI|nr:putative glycosyl hydrolases family 18 protein [Elsinoe australis]
MKIGGDDTAPTTPPHPSAPPPLSISIYTHVIIHSPRTMAEIAPRPSEPHTPRLVVYHQTHHTGPQGEQTPVSILPLLSENTGVTHIIIAAVHLNDGNNLTLNDDPPTSPKFNQLWDEVAIAQASGIKVLAMLGGAAKGSYERLSGSEESVRPRLPPASLHPLPLPIPSLRPPLSPVPHPNARQFNSYYTQLHTFLTTHSLSGIDLDIEEETPLPSVLRLIDRLRATLPASFLITLAPVLPALIPNQPHLSGFSYFDLERFRSRQIDWYNVQLYCGWGDAGSPEHYLWMVRSGWDPRRCVMGCISNPENGSGFVEMERLGAVVGALRQAVWGWGGTRGEAFGGVACWEYFNAKPGGRERPWEWAGAVGGMLSVEVEGRGGGTVGGAGAGSAQAQHPFPAESVKTLTELGFSHVQAVAALNRTGGNVEYAAGLLFEG